MHCRIWPLHKLHSDILWNFALGGLVHCCYSGSPTWKVNHCISVVSQRTDTNGSFSSQYGGPQAPGALSTFLKIVDCPHVSAISGGKHTKWMTSHGDESSAWVLPPRFSPLSKLVSVIFITNELAIQRAAEGHCECLCVCPVRWSLAFVSCHRTVTHLPVWRTETSQQGLETFTLREPLSHAFLKEASLWGRDKTVILDGVYQSCHALHTSSPKMSSAREESAEGVLQGTLQVQCELVSSQFNFNIMISNQ